MTTAIGPQSRNYATTRPPTTGVASGGADTWAKNCSGPNASDGTFLDASFYNVLIAQLRTAIRSAGIPLDDEDDEMLAKAIKTLSGAYDIGGYCDGLPQESETIASIICVRAFTLPGNLVGSQAKAVAAATALTIFAIKKNGVSVGTMQFDADSAVATFVTDDGLSISLDAGDTLTIEAPSSQDSTLASISFLLKGSLY